MEKLFVLGMMIGLFLFASMITTLLYVFKSFAHMKALNALGYDKAWLAWIPFVIYYGLADAVCGNEKKVTLFGKIEIPSILFKLWWVLSLVLFFLYFNTGKYSLIIKLLNIVFLGCTYAKMYARLYGKTEKKMQILGCISGYIPFIASCKFITIK